MRKAWLAIPLLAAQLAATPAFAWDEIGHEVIARIAWEGMTPRARAAAVALLTNAPELSSLLELYPAQGSRTLGDRTFFVEASTWADIVRDQKFPERRQAYHRAPWHYVNYFFEDTPEGPRDRPDLPPDTAHIVERLDALEDAVVNLDRPSELRAIDLAWILHMVGDIHQPLHTTARVTPETPRGDQGGNLFPLDGRNTLHGYWDGAIRRNFDRQPGESEHAYVERIARTIMDHHPPARFAGELNPGQYEQWARAGFATSKAQVYGTPPGQAPSEEYGRATYTTAERAAALAGYRLANLLNRILAGE